MNVAANSSPSASEAEVSEERIGSLLVRAAPPADGPLHDELPLVEITRPDANVAVGSFRSPIVTLLASFLAFGLLSFAIFVRSWPAVGVIGVAVGALAWLVLRGGKRTIERTRVGVAGGELRVVTPERRFSAPVKDVEGLGLGEDGPYLTVFARVRAEGRVLLLDGLTRDEAETAAARLGDALARAAA